MSSVVRRVHEAVVLKGDEEKPVDVTPAKLEGDKAAAETVEVDEVEEEINVDGLLMDNKVVPKLTLSLIENQRF